VTFDVSLIDSTISDITGGKKILLNGVHQVDFDPAEDIKYVFAEPLPCHPNTLAFVAHLENGEEVAEKYFSVGGGFVQSENEEPGKVQYIPFRYPVTNAADISHWCRTAGISISEMVMHNEVCWRPEGETKQYLL